MKAQGLLISFLVVLIVGASFAAGYFFVKSQKSTTPSVSDQKIIVTPTISTSPTNGVVATVGPTSTPKTGHTAVVVFEPPLGGEFADKAAIQTKIVNPFLDYYADENGEGFLVSLSIAKNLQESKTAYPYTANAIFNNGGNSGFTIAKTDGVIPWWAPDCMKCTFSTSFKAKYPEIVKQYE